MKTLLLISGLFLFAQNGSALEIPSPAETAAEVLTVLEGNWELDPEQKGEDFSEYSYSVERLTADQEGMKTGDWKISGEFSSDCCTGTIAQVYRIENKMILEMDGSTGKFKPAKVLNTYGNLALLTKIVISKSTYAIHHIEIVAADKIRMFANTFETKADGKSILLEKGVVIHLVRQN